MIEILLNFIHCDLKILLAAGWISALCIVRSGDEFFNKNNKLDEYVKTYQAYLVIVFLGFFASIGIFLLNFFNIPNLKILRKLPWLFMVNLLILSVY